MTDYRSKVDKLIEDLETQRDELLVKMHLAKAEAKEEWEGLEEKWQDLQKRLTEVRAAASESAGNVGAALELVADEIGKAYKRLRDSLD